MGKRDKAYDRNGVKLGLAELEIKKWHVPSTRKAVLVGLMVHGADHLMFVPR